MRWLLLGLAACGGASSVPPSTAPADPTAASAGSAAAEGAGIDGVWRFRSLHVGLVQKMSQLTRFTLKLQGDEATMVVQHQFMEGSDADVVGGEWQTFRTETVRGTVRKDGGSVGALELQLTGSGTAYAFGCRRMRIEVAVAHAVRIPDPAFTDECGNEGTWSPAVKVSREILYCESGEIGPFEMGRGAGLELLWVNDDCIMQGNGVREVADDGAIAPPRAPDGSGEDRD